MANKPLILTEEHINSINKILLNTLKQSEAKCALLVDQAGKCLAKKGFTKTIDTDALAALIAGSFSSTRAMARLVGETDFSVLFHQGAKDHIHNIIVDDDTILTIIFDDRTTIGMVRLYSKESAKSLREILKNARKVTKLKVSDLELHQEAEKRLDDIFDKGKNK